MDKYKEKLKELRDRLRSNRAAKTKFLEELHEQGEFTRSESDGTPELSAEHKAQIARWDAEFDAGKAEEATLLDLIRTQKQADDAAEVEDEVEPSPAPSVRSSLPDGSIERHYRCQGEARVYSPNSEYSIFVDMMAARGRDIPGVSRHDAQERLARHAAQENAESSHADSQYRVRAATTADLGGQILPAYDFEVHGITDTGMPFANQCSIRPLNNQTVNLSYEKQTTTVAEQTTENSALSDANYETEGFAITAQTFGGVSEQSIQGVDFSQIDSADITGSLRRQWEEQIENVVINGNPTAAAQKGVLNFSAAAANTKRQVAEIATAAGDRGKAVNLYNKIVDARTRIRKVATREPNVVVMTPDIWAIFEKYGSTQQDLPINVVSPYMSQARNVTAVGTLPAFSGRYDMSNGVVGAISGMPVVMSYTIPSNLNTNQTAIIVANRMECKLYLSAPRLEYNESPGFKTATVTWRLLGYGAFTINTLPSCVAKITGAGLQV